MALTTTGSDILLAMQLWDEVKIRVERAYPNKTPEEQYQIAREVMIHGLKIKAKEVHTK